MGHDLSSVRSRPVPKSRVRCLIVPQFISTSIQSWSIPFLLLEFTDIISRLNIWSNFANVVSKKFALWIEDTNFGMFTRATLFSTLYSIFVSIFDYPCHIFVFISNFLKLLLYECYAMLWDIKIHDRALLWPLFTLLNIFCLEVNLVWCLSLCSSGVFLAFVFIQPLPYLTSWLYSLYHTLSCFILLSSNFN